MTDSDFAPRAVQLLSLAVGLQVVFLIGLFWRGIFGKSRQTGMRPRWLYAPLLAGTALGVWYGVLRDDLVFILAQALALFLGVCVLRSPRAGGDSPGAGSSGGPRQGQSSQASTGRGKAKGRNA